MIVRQYWFSRSENIPWRTYGRFIETLYLDFLDAVCETSLWPKHRKNLNEGDALICRYSHEIYHTPSHWALHWLQWRSQVDDNTWRRAYFAYKFDKAQQELYTNFFQQKGYDVKFVWQKWTEIIIPNNIEYIWQKWTDIMVPNNTPIPRINVCDMLSQVRAWAVLYGKRDSTISISLPTNHQLNHQRDNVLAIQSTLAIHGYRIRVWGSGSISIHDTELIALFQHRWHPVYEYNPIDLSSDITKLCIVTWHQNKSLSL